MNGDFLAARFMQMCMTTFIVTAMFVSPTDVNAAIRNRQLLLPVFYSCVVLWSLLLYFTVSFMDPGFVRKEDDDVEQLRVLVETEEGGSSVKLNTNSQNVTFNLKPHQRCGFCKLKKPMRAKHCRDCGRCVRKFDHHCFWMANCVGERNHKFFLAFVSTELVLLLWSFKLSLTGYVKPEEPRDWMRTNLLVIIADVIMAVFIFVTFILFTMHFYTALTNNTTWESISKKRIPYLRKLPGNPFDVGICRNFYLFCCTCKAQDWNAHYQRAREKMSYRKMRLGSSSSSDDDDRSNLLQTQQVQ